MEDPILHGEKKRGVLVVGRLIFGEIGRMCTVGWDSLGRRMLVSDVTFLPEYRFPHA
jgi:hypothetical protein